MQNIVPQTPNLPSFCKNHPEITSGYFLTDFPQTQYCKNCALNAALCGRKIQKKLTQEELHRKVQILNLTDQLIACVDQTKISQQLYMKLEDYLHEVCLPLQLRIKEIDTFINELSVIRDKMNQIYTKQLQGEVQRCRKLRDDSSINEIQIKKVIEHIQCNFTSLIELQDSMQFQKEEKEWRKILEENRKSIMDKLNFQEKMAYIKENVSNFLTSYTKATEMRVEKMKFICNQYKEGDNKENCQLWIDETNLQGSRLVEELKLNLTANAQLKTRPKKQITDRQHPSFSKKANRRQSTQVNEATQGVPQSKKSRR